MFNKKAFTLTELLIALGIIGAIAAMTIPSVMSEINNRILVTSLKNNVSSLQTLIGDQFAKYKTNNLMQTDFASADRLLTSKNFDVVKICTADKAEKECWKTKPASGSGDAPVKYRNLHPDNKNFSETFNYRTVVLKNGAILCPQNEFSDVKRQYPNEPAFVWYFIDVNGNDGPNIAGRDLFDFKIYEDGSIGDNNDGSWCGESITSNDASSCFYKILADGWKMNY